MRESAGVRLLRSGLLAGVVILALPSCNLDEPSASPTFTAQGFDLAEPRGTRVGETPSVRLRIEAPAGLEALRVKERSYEVDLARSPEPSHFPLFGLPQRVWSKTDVTLDFGPYVAEKMSRAGEYSFDIVATDRRDRSAGATLRIIVEPLDEEPGEDAVEAPPSGAAAPSPAASDDSASTATALRAADFRLERVGSGPVQHADDLGISWTTIESNRVVIRIVGAADETSRFAHLEPGSFVGIETREQLASAILGLGLQPSLEVAAANNAAAGTELAVVHENFSYLLRADYSETHLSDLGTTVTLVGRYKQ